MFQTLNVIQRRHETNTRVCTRRLVCVLWRNFRSPTAVLWQGGAWHLMDRNSNSYWLQGI